MTSAWPNEDWEKAVEIIKAKYPGIAAAAALKALEEAGFALFWCGHEHVGEEGYCLECGARIEGSE